MSSANASMMKKTVLVVLADPSKGPSQMAVPLLESLKHKADFIVGDSIETFKNHAAQLKEAKGLIWVPPGDVSILPTLFDTYLPNVKWVHSWFAGIEPIHPFILSHLMSRDDVVVTNAKGAFSRSLAEYAIATMLHYEKQIERIQSNTKSKKWDKFIMTELNNKTVGFIGFGDIAKSIAKITKHAFNMKNIACRRNVTTQGKDDDLADEVFSSEIEEQKLKVFQQADFVICTLPGTASTLKFCGKKQFESMKSDAVFISLGRGTVVDEEALYDVLKAKAIKGAALDVFNIEPLSQDSPLWTLDNILITAHNADWTPDYSEQALKVLEQNLDAMTEGKKFVTPIEKKAGY